MIDPQTFDYKESRIKDLYSFFKNKGYEVYFPSQKEGECKSPYIVVKLAGSYKMFNFSTNIDVYKILIYVPRDNYTMLDKLKMQVKEDMKELRPMFEENGYETVSFYEDQIKAHSVSIDYNNYKKI